MICIELSFTDDPARLAARPAHRQRLVDMQARGLLLAAGPWGDDSGALLVLTTDEPGAEQRGAARWQAGPDHSSKTAVQTNDTAECEASLISFGSYIANYREERLLTNQTLPNEMRTTTRNGMSNDHHQPSNQTLRTTASTPITKPSTRALKYEGGLRRV